MGLRDELRGRGLPQATFSIRRVPSEELAAAEAELDAAIGELRDAEAARRVSSALRQQVEDAAARLDACFRELTIRALPPADLEALVNAHPATEAQRDKVPDAAWNRDTFAPALLAVCVFDEPGATEPALTESEWVQETTKGSMSLGEIGALFEACWRVNDRSPDVRLPKGSTPTRS
jgi:hypothetical protein